MASVDTAALARIINDLRKLRLPQMAEDLLVMSESGELYTMEALAALERMTSDEVLARKNNKIRRLKKEASFSQKNACLEELDYQPDRKLNASVIEQLSTNGYIEQHRNVMILGACGTGKSYLCNALGNNACDGTFRVLYKRMFELLSELQMAQMEHGNVLKMMDRYVRPDLLIIDDFLIHPVNDKDTENLFKVLEYRYGRGSTIIGSQLDPEEWHKRLGSDIMADSILDRIMPNSYKLILSGDSMRNRK